MRRQLQQTEKYLPKYRTDLICRCLINTSVVDRLAHARLKHKDLKRLLLQEILHDDSEQLIELAKALILWPTTAHASKERLPLKDTPSILLIENAQHTGIVADTA